MSLQGEWQVREGFRVEKVLSGLAFPVNIAFVPDASEEKGSPLFYVTELYGRIKVVTNEFKASVFADKLLNYEPDFMLPGTGESGVIGIAVHDSSDVYASMLYAEDNKFKNKLIRIETNDGLKAERIVTILDNIPPSTRPTRFRRWSFTMRSYT